MTDWKLARRDLLRKLGLGAACLPLLRATRARGAPARNPRLLCVLATEGYRLADWKPAPGPLGALPPSASPLTQWKDQLIFLPDLVNASLPDGRRGLGGYPTIFYGLPEVTGAPELPEPKGPTVDQVVGNALPRIAGGRPSLALGVQVDLPPIGPLAGRRSSWRGPGMPVTPEGDPMATYQALFSSLGGGPDLAELKRRLAERKAVMKYVGGSLESFGKRLGSEDRGTVQAHLAAINDLEQQITQRPAFLQACGSAPDATFAVDPTDQTRYLDVLNLQLSLAIMALECGVTRVVTLQLTDWEGGNVNFSFVPGVPTTGTGYKSPYRNWRDLGHNPVIGGVDHKRLVDQWWMDKLASVLRKLEAVQEPGGGTLLDSTAVLWANTVDDGTTLNPRKVPWLLAGRGAGALKTGQCVASAGRPTSAVLASLCHAMGVTAQPFGPPMAEIVA
jgi:hypothetical protein